MKIKISKNDYLVYVQKGESVMSTLTHVCNDYEILNGQISGIGAVKDIEMGVYDWATKSYLKKQFPDILELLSFQGNITLKENHPFIHAHITVGNHDMNVMGGHLFEMTVAVVGEFFIRKIDTDAYRKFDEDIQLPVWCLESE
jgi:hypothetical protein